MLNVTHFGALPPRSQLFWHQNPKSTVCYFLSLIFPSKFSDSQPHKPWLRHLIIKLGPMTVRSAYFDETSLPVK